MSQSLSKLYIHIIFHTKGEILIRDSEEADLHAYIGAIIKVNDCMPIIINGTENHLHILCTLSKNITLAKLVEEIKRNSSRWIKTKHDYYSNFAWQGGYAGYSVSQSKCQIVKQYIEKQKEHHEKKDFKEEYVEFLKEYGIDYNEAYLWT